MEAAMVLVLWRHMGSTWVQHHFWEPTWRHGAVPGGVSGMCWLVKMMASMKWLIMRKFWHLEADIINVWDIINGDQRRSLVYITIYLFNCSWSPHFLFSFNYVIRCFSSWIPDGNTIKGNYLPVLSTEICPSRYVNVSIYWRRIFLKTTMKGTLKQLLKQLQFQTLRDDCHFILSAQTMQRKVYLLLFAVDLCLLLDLISYTYC